MPALSFTLGEGAITKAVISPYHSQEDAPLRQDYATVLER